MRLWVAAGGTGGHVYPALAIVERIVIGDQRSVIREQGARGKATEPVASLPFDVASQSAIGNRQSAILWVGSEGGVEESLVKREGVAYVAIPAGGLHGVGIMSAIRNLLRLILGALRSLQLIEQYRPDALLTTGGFISAPVVVACWLRRVPILLYLPDIEPGLAVKFAARFATQIGVTTEDSAKYFPARKVIVTGYPTRSDLARADRNEAIRHFDLVPDRKTLLVFGGSRGARSINRAVEGIVEQLVAKYQVIHISGSTDAAEVRAKNEALPEELKRHYHVFDYVHEMGLALAAADLVVSRAGASVLGEYPLFGLPAILVPYPFAWRYQRVNADYLASRGAAVQLDDATLTQTLWPSIDQLMSNAVQLQTMSRAARSLARPDPALRLAEAWRVMAGAAP